MISKIYLDKNIQEDISKAYRKSSPNHIALFDFFEEESLQNLEILLKKERREFLCIPNKYSYKKIGSKLIENKLISKDLISILEEITKKRINNIKISIKEFSHKNYTLLHDEEKENKSIKFFIFLNISDKWKKEFGANIIYKIKDEKENLIFTPIKNTFYLISPEKNDSHFIEYVNHLSKNESVIILQGEVD